MELLGSKPISTEEITAAAVALRRRIRLLTRLRHSTLGLIFIIAELVYVASDDWGWPGQLCMLAIFSGCAYASARLSGQDPMETIICSPVTGACLLLFGIGSALTGGAVSPEQFMAAFYGGTCVCLGSLAMGGFCFERNAKKRLADYTPLSDSQSLCPGLRQACIDSAPCDTYRLAALRQGRELTAGEARRLISEVDEWQKSAGKREALLQQQIDCALLRSAEAAFEQV